ncbi:hypothetical protein ABHI18_002270, partial [Aspergillus niger]
MSNPSQAKRDLLEEREATLKCLEVIKAAQEHVSSGVKESRSLHKPPP